MGPDPHTKSMTRHFLLESFVWEEAIRVKFLTGLAREGSLALAHYVGELT
jgi:hypothetical protein